MYIAFLRLLGMFKSYVGNESFFLRIFFPANFTPELRPSDTFVFLMP